MNIDDLKNAYVEMINRNEPNLTMTLMSIPGHCYSNQFMRNRLKHLDATVSRKILGRNWYKKPETIRMHGVFVLEHSVSGTYPHWHGLVRVPEDQLIRYRYLIKEHWDDSKWRSWTSSDPVQIEKYSKKSTHYLLKEVSMESTEKIVFTNMLRN